MLHFSKELYIRTYISVNNSDDICNHIKAHICKYQLTIFALMKVQKTPMIFPLAIFVSLLSPPKLAYSCTYLAMLRPSTIQQYIMADLSLTKNVSANRCPKFSFGGCSPGGLWTEGLQLDPAAKHQ